MRTFKLIRKRVPTAGMIALAMLGQTCVASAVPSIRVVATLPQSPDADAQHLSGDALPVGSKYRILVSPDGATSLTVESVFDSGKRDRLFSADKVTPNRSIVLPRDGSWYTASRTPGELRVVVTQADAVVEHLVRTIESSPTTEIRRLRARGERAKDIGPGQLVDSSIEGDVDEVYQRASAYRSAAVKLALAKEPAIRGGPGVTVFRTAAPAVVLIQTDKSTGSGIVVSQRGEVLTNWHVIDGAKFIAVVLKPPAGQRLSPGDVYEARLLKYDQVADLALIQFQRTPPNLALLRTADDRTPIEVGSTAHAIGHPAGQQWTYSQGVISNVRNGYGWKGDNDCQHTATVIQTITPISPGSSGGPLLDDKAAVIGVNTFFMKDKQGLNYAVSVDEIRRFLKAPGNRECVKQPKEGAGSSGNTKPPGETKACEQKDHRRFPPLQDPVTNKIVVPFDFLCAGRPNAWLVGNPAEYFLVDRKGDGKIDVKIVYKFAPDIDLWIVYGKRDEVPTQFGYDYGRKGKPDRWVTVNPPHL